ncbi:MAG: hypothetical protein R3F28_01660 [Candidatus Kapaibacterium sp.]|nr:hypothetical protein [Ignavibacteria bacterium]
MLCLIIAHPAVLPPITTAQNFLTHTQGKLLLPITQPTIHHLSPQIYPHVSHAEHTTRPPKIFLSRRRSSPPAPRADITTLQTAFAQLRNLINVR